MSLRTRFALAFALVSVVVAGLVGILSYHAAAERTTQATDTTLAAATSAVADGQTGVLAPIAPPSPDDDDRPRPGPRRADDRGRLQELVGRSIAPDGTATFLGGRDVAIPVTARARTLASASAAGLTDTVETTVGFDTYRVLTTSEGGGRGAWQVAMDIDLSRRVLRGMANEIALVTLVVLVVAAGAGWLLAGRITRRLERLTELAEQVTARGGTATTELPADGRDEVGRLSASFATMVGRLAASREAQDRLVQDAAHELRTPLTSLRTNASVLQRFAELSPEARERLLADVQGETRELSHLVDELVALALSGGDPEDDEEVVDLDAVVRRVAARTGRRSGREVLVESDGSVVQGFPGALERAVGNLLENAAKFDGSGAALEVEVRDGGVAVRDHGPGIDVEDVERVFDRFYRAPAARGLPGSGLGLAIVRDVAERHGGAAFVTSPAGGGARVGFTVAPERLLPDSEADHVEASPPGTTVGGT